MKLVKMNAKWECARYLYRPSVFCTEQRDRGMRPPRNIQGLERAMARPTKYMHIAYDESRPESLTKRCTIC